MLCTLPRMERATSEDLQVCGLCTCAPTHAQTALLLFLVWNLVVLWRTDVYLFAYTLHHEMSACQTILLYVVLQVY